MSHDIVIKNAIVADGTGSQTFAADVAIDGDRIAAVGTISSAARREIDATGLVLSPGFIDVHTHDDFALLTDPHMSCKTLQGVTTVVTGNCGTSAVPFGEWVRKVDEAKPSLNIIGLIGHGSVRNAVMGSTDFGGPTSTQMTSMKAYIDEALDDGAAGISTGLVYVPGAFSSYEELIELVSPVAERGGIYTSHIRNEASDLILSIEEAIAIGRTTGIRVQISHLKVIGAENFNLIPSAIETIRAARTAGVDVMADQYPYSRGSTQLKQLVLRGAFDGPSPFGFVQGCDVLISSAPHTPEWEGLTLEAISKFLEMDTPTTARHIVSIEEDGCTVVYQNQSEENIERILREDFVMVGSDGIPMGSQPHPRLHHTFPRVLGEFSRTRSVLSMEMAVHKMTYLSAQRFGIPDRGMVAPGHFADLVLFDPGLVRDTGTYEKPTTVPSGIVETWVNGESVAQAGGATSTRSGRFIRTLA